MTGLGGRVLDSEAFHRPTSGGVGERSSSRGHFELSVADVFSSPMTIASSSESIDEDMVWELAKEFKASDSETDSVPSPDRGRIRKRDRVQQAPKPLKPSKRFRKIGGNTQSPQHSTPPKKDRPPPAGKDLNEQELLQLARQTDVVPPRAVKSVMRAHGAKFQKKTAAELKEAMTMGQAKA